MSHIKNLKRNHTGGQFWKIYILSTFFFLSDFLQLSYDGIQAPRHVTKSFISAMGNDCRRNRHFISWNSKYHYTMVQLHINSYFWNPFWLVVHPISKKKSNRLCDTQLESIAFFMVFHHIRPIPFFFSTLSEKNRLHIRTFYDILTIEIKTQFSLTLLRWEFLSEKKYNFRKWHCIYK